MVILYYQTPIEISTNKIKQKEVRSYLESLHESHLMQDTKQRYWKEEIRSHKSKIRTLKKAKKWVVLEGIPERLNTIHNANLFPDYLFDLYAPFFYKKFPKGKIVFIPFDRSIWEKIIIDDIQLSKKYKPDGRDSSGESQGYGLDFESTMSGLGLKLPFIIRYPYVHGSIAGSIHGYTCFIPDKPIHIFNGDEWTFREFLLDKTKYFYSDSMWEPFSNPRDVWKPLELDNFIKYFKWYVSSLNNLFDFVFQLPNAETRKLAFLSLSRICLDTYIIQLTEQPYLRKVLFLTLVDKYANLISYLGNKGNETQIWKNLLSFSFFEDRIKPIVKKIPSEVGFLPYTRYYLRQLIRHLFAIKYGNPRIKPKSHESDALDLLRTYRNSHHGYFLTKPQERQRFLEHTGDIPNFLPDLSYYLWHVLIADPSALINCF